MPRPGFSGAAAAASSSSRGSPVTTVVAGIASSSPRGSPAGAVVTFRPPPGAYGYAGGSCSPRGRRFSAISARSHGSRVSVAGRGTLSVTSEAMVQRAFFLPAGGIGASVFNLCSATLGAGVLALPRCGAYSGPTLVTLYVVLSGLASAYAIVVLTMVANRTGWMSYEEMALHLLGGRKWVYTTVLLIALLCFGTAVGYVIVIGDILDPIRTMKNAPDWLADDSGRYLSQIAWWLLLFLPVSLPKHVNALRYASCTGVWAIAFLIGLLAVKLGSEGARPEVESIRGGVGSLFSLPVIMFGYGCQVNTFEIYGEMHKPSVRRMSLAAGIAIGICSCYYIVAGIVGYLAFGNDVKSNVLANLDPTGGSGMDIAAAVAFAACSVTVTMAFPLCVFPTRDAIMFLIWPPASALRPTPSASGSPTTSRAALLGDDVNSASTDSPVIPQVPSHSDEIFRSATSAGAKTVGAKTLVRPPNRRSPVLSPPGSPREAPTASETQRIIVVLIICVAILLAGLFIPNITTVFGIIGGLCIGAIGYTIPALFAIRSGHWTVDKVGRVHVYMTWILLVYGMLCALVGTGVSIYHITTSESE
jgi:amino acid permease